MQSVILTRGKSGPLKMLLDRSNLFYSFCLIFLIILECLRSTKDSSQVFFYIPQTSSISGLSFNRRKTISIQEGGLLMKTAGCRADCQVESVRTGKGNPLAPAMLWVVSSGFPEHCVKPPLREKQCCDPLLMSAVVWKWVVMGQFAIPIPESRTCLKHWHSLR